MTKWHQEKDVIVAKLKALVDNSQSLRPYRWVLRVCSPKIWTEYVVVVHLVNMLRDRSNHYRDVSVGRHFSISSQQRVTDDDTGD